VAEVTAGVEPISHSLLEDLGIREAVILLAVPQDISVVRDLKDASSAWKQCNLTEVGPKGGKQLLRHPSSAQEPLALRAVGDCNAWLASSGHRLRISGTSRIKATGPLTIKRLADVGATNCLIAASGRGINRMAGLQLGAMQASD